MTGNLPGGRVVIFDDDHYYMGGVLAELLVNSDCSVTLVTPAAYVSEWTNNTFEQASIHRRLVALGVEIVLNRAVSKIANGKITIDCVYTGQSQDIAADALLYVTCRVGDDALWNDLHAREDEWEDRGIRSIKLIGDAEAPAPIAWATYAGHRYARELDMPDIGDALPFRREVAQLKA